MVSSFNFARIPLIYFGPGKLNLLPVLIRRFGTRIILVSNDSSFNRTEAAGELFSALRKEGIEFPGISVPGEPTPDIIDNAVEGFMDERIDAVVAVGGGSVMDAGKAISAMLYRRESVMEYLEGVGNREHPGAKVPFIAIPTTAGTGSEATKNAVISRIGRDGFKRSLRHDNFVPDIALVDPVLSVSCSTGVTASSGMDCFSQLIEAFLSTKATLYTDALAWEGLKAVRGSLMLAWEDGKNIEARTGMAFAALTSGICLSNAGLGTVHGFASAIGGLFGVPHGIICGTLAASANEATVKQIRSGGLGAGALKKYSALGRLFTDADEKKADDYYVDAFVEYLWNLTEILHLPPLGEFGIGEEDLKMICRETDSKNNPVSLDEEHLESVLRSRL